MHDNTQANVVFCYNRANSEFGWASERSIRTELLWTGSDVERASGRCTHTSTHTTTSTHTYGALWTPDAASECDLSGLIHLNLHEHKSTDPPFLHRPTSLPYRGTATERSGGTWKHYVAGNTVVDFIAVWPERRRSERRVKHAHLGVGLPAAAIAAASAPSLPDFSGPVLERPVQLEGQVSSTPPSDLRVEEKAAENRNLTVIKSVKVNWAAAATNMHSL